MSFPTGPDPMHVEDGRVCIKEFAVRELKACLDTRLCTCTLDWVDGTGHMNCRRENEASLR